MAKRPALKPDSHILIVDDLMEMRVNLAACLADLGFKNILQMPNGEEALHKIRFSQFDLIIADWNMPKMDGMKFLEEVRRSPSHKEVPFVMITAAADKEKVLKALKGGVSSFIVKPFTPDIIRAKLNDIFEKH